MLTGRGPACQIWRQRGGASSASDYLINRNGLKDVFDIAQQEMGKIMEKSGEQSDTSSSIAYYMPIQRPGGAASVAGDSTAAPGSTVACLSEVETGSESGDDDLIEV